MTKVSLHLKVTETVYCQSDWTLYFAASRSKHLHVCISEKFNWRELDKIIGFYDEGDGHFGTRVLG